MGRGGACAWEKVGTPLLAVGARKMGREKAPSSETRKALSGVKAAGALVGALRAVLEAAAEVLLHRGAALRARTWGLCSK